MLLTESFPFVGPDDPFLPYEIKVLSRDFEVLLVPTMRRLDSNSQQVVDGNVNIAEGLEHSTSLKVIGTLRTILSDSARAHIPAGVKLAPVDRLVLARRWVRVVAARRWTRDVLLQMAGDRECAVYSWWSFAPAYGVALGLAGTNIPMVSRIHGYDLYPEQDRLGFIPFQEDLLARVSGMYSVSQAGADFLRASYPRLADRVGVAYLGVDGPESLCQGSGDGVFRLVTCSSATPVKRLDRMIDSVSALNAQGARVEWTHLGGGPLLECLRSRGQELGGSVRFVGQLPPAAVLPWLTRHPVDLFCNVSDSEGLPVSLMEAASCGIPMLARDVGGNREIVDASVGCLLPATCEAADIAEAIRGIIKLPESETQQLRLSSRERWAQRFQAEANYAAFSEMLMARARAR